MINWNASLVNNIRVDWAKDRQTKAYLRERGSEGKTWFMTVVVMVEMLMMMAVIKLLWAKFRSKVLDQKRADAVIGRIIWGRITSASAPGLESWFTQIVRRNLNPPCTRKRKKSFNRKVWYMYFLRVCVDKKKHLLILVNKLRKNTLVRKLFFPYVSSPFQYHRIDSTTWLTGVWLNVQFYTSTGVVCICVWQAVGLLSSSSVHLSLVVVQFPKKWIWISYHEIH